MLTPVAGVTSRRTFLGLAAAGVTGATAAAVSLWPGSRSAAKHAAAPRRPEPAATRRAVPENSLPGDPDWELRHLGAEHEIEGYAGKASVLTGESFPLFVSTTSSGFRVSAFRLGWYGGDGARKVWQSGAVRGRAQRGPAMTGATIPTELAAAIAAAPDDDAVRALGVSHCISQCVELLEAGVPGLHFYTFNRARAPMEILTALHGQQLLTA